MKENELIQQLHKLRFIFATKKMHADIAIWTKNLPDKHKGFYFPLFAFQMAIIGIVICILVGLGSGVVVAAQAHVGSPLYPIRQLLHTIAPKVVQQDEASQPLRKEESFPTPTETSSPQSIKHTKEHEVDTHEMDQGEKETDKKTDSEVLHTTTDVKAAHDEQKSQDHSKENPIENIHDFLKKHLPSHIF